jgi:hypothetical protein
MNRFARMPRLLLLLLSLAAAGCGPLVAQVLRVGEGVERSAVLPGSAAPPKAGARLLILSPFAKTPDSFYLCKGEDEEALAAAFRDGKRFGAEAVQRRKAEEAAALADSLRGKGAAKAKEPLGLSFEPDWAVTGTILSRRTLVSPFRGVVMDVSYRLVFRDLRTDGTWTVEVAVKTLAEKSVPAVAREVERLASPAR